MIFASQAGRFFQDEKIVDIRQVLLKHKKGISGSHWCVRSDCSAFFVFVKESLKTLRINLGFGSIL